MNDIEKSVVTAVKDSANTITEKFPFVSGGDAFTWNVFNVLRTLYPAVVFQNMNIVNVLEYHIQKDILEYAKSCFTEEKLEQYLEPK
jgi:hypothetical protein